jgi:hypothetical protein
LVRGSFSNYIGPYILSTCGPLCSFLGPFGVAQMPQNSQRKKILLLFWTISSTRMGLLILLGAYFQAKTLGQTSCPNEPKKGTQRPVNGWDVWPNVLV